MAGISSKAAGEMNNKEKTFQGQRVDDDLGINWIQFKWRNHDPQIGRFVEIDPLSEKYVYNSTYAFSENKVTNDVELEGLESVSANLLWPLYRWMGISEDPRINARNAGTTTEQEKKDESPASSGSSYFNMQSFHAANSILMDAATLWVLPGGEGNAEESEVTVSSKSGAVVESEAHAASQGTTLTIKAKPTWNQSQMAQAEAKAVALSDGQSVVTKNMVPRDPNLRNNFVKAGGQVGAGQDVDHIRELQLGGTNANTNLQALDASVNRSFGRQIQAQIKNLPEGTMVNRVVLVPSPLPSTPSPLPSTAGGMPMLPLIR